MRWAWCAAVAGTAWLGVLAKDDAAAMLSDILAHQKYEVVFQNSSVPLSWALAQLQNHGPSARPASANATDPWYEAPSGYELYRITDTESYLCRMPLVEHEPRAQEPVHELSEQEISGVIQRGLALLAPLRDTDLAYRMGYFMHVFRYGQHILQLPNDIAQLLAQKDLPLPRIDPERLPKDHYLLGKWRAELEAGETPVETRLVPYPSTGDSEDARPRSTDVFMLEQVWRDGTACDLNGAPRQTRVRMYCGTPTLIEQLSEVKELCTDPAFQLQHTQPVHAVQCRLIGPDDDAERDAYVNRVRALHAAKHGAEEVYDVNDAESAWEAAQAAAQGVGDTLPHEPPAVVLDTSNLGDLPPDIQDALKKLEGIIQNHPDLMNAGEQGTRDTALHDEDSPLFAPETPEQGHYAEDL